MMESTLDTITQHARALEDAAMERHRLRMERSQDTLRVAMHDAVEQFKRETSSIQTAQQIDLQQFRDQHAQQLADARDQNTAHLAETLAQVTSQIKQLRLHVSTRLYNGNLVTPSVLSTETEVSARHMPQMPRLPTSPRPSHLSIRRTHRQRLSLPQLDLLLRDAGAM
jgi:cell division septum initiation protein DivIVA